MMLYDCSNEVLEVCRVGNDDLAPTEWKGIPTSRNNVIFLAVFVSCGIIYRAQWKNNGRMGLEAEGAIAVSFRATASRGLW